MKYVYICIAIVVFLGSMRYFHYSRILNNAAYTVGIVIGNTSNRKGEVGDIIYKYKVGNQLLEQRQGNLLFRTDPSSGKFVVLYDKTNPKSSIIWLNYPCSDYSLGINLDSIIIKSKIQLSPWSLDLVSNGWE
jgi:hypothetical protein